MTRFRSFAMVTRNRTSVIAALATLAMLVVGVYGANQPAAAQGSPGHPAVLSPGPGRIQISFAAARGKASRHGKAVWQSTAIRRYVAAVNARLTLPVNENMHFRPGDSYDAPPFQGQPLDLGYNDPGENLQLFEYFGVFTPQETRHDQPHRPGAPPPTSRRPRRGRDLRATATTRSLSRRGA
jgi:hypothetical protein